MLSFGRLGLFCLMAAPMLLQPAIASAAGQATHQMPVEVTVPAGCTVRAQRVDFGSVTVATLPRDATGTIELRCAPGTSYTVALDNGLHASAAQRRMYAGAVGLPLLRYVTYNLYRDAARTQPWTAAAGQVVSGTAPANGLVNVTVFGRMPLNLVMAVPYRDTVTVTVNF